MPYTNHRIMHLGDDSLLVVVETGPEDRVMRSCEEGGHLIYSRAFRMYKTSKGEYIQAEPTEDGYLSLDLNHGVRASCSAYGYVCDSIDALSRHTNRYVSIDEFVEENFKGGLYQ